MLYDALVVVSFGGPEKTQDVIPFLENVLRGRNVPRERMLEVAEHYYHFGGVSPINGQNRELVAALRRELDLPVYWGNRNWHPMLADTFRQMRQDGIRRALAFVTSAFGSYSGCRQYREDIARAVAEIGDPPLIVDKLRTFSNHPLFLETMADRAAAAFEQIPDERRAAASLIFTAHSVPSSMAAVSPYERQLREAASLVAASIGRPEWTLVYQSRSGPPSQPWLAPGIADWLRENRPRDVVVVPLGFISDHMEVLYDLDTTAMALCDELGINMVRAGTAGTHPKFIAMIADLVREGSLGAAPDICPTDCCAARPK